MFSTHAITLVLILRTTFTEVNAQAFCGAQLSGQSGEFRYPPNYPASYPENVQCRWAINAPPGHTIQIQFNHPFGLPGRDFLAIVDGSLVRQLPQACDIPGYFNLGTQGQAFILIRGEQSEYMTFTSITTSAVAIFCSQSQRGSTIPRIGFRATFFTFPRFLPGPFQPLTTPRPFIPIQTTSRPFIPQTPPPIPVFTFPPFVIQTTRATTTTTTTTTSTQRPLIFTPPPITQSPFTNDAQCGIPFFPPLAGRIIGGSPAVFGSWPYMVAIIDSRYNGQFCGAVLIDEFWVLTAAHCLVDKPAQHLLLRIGATDFNASATDPKRGVDRTAAFTIIQPAFNGNSFQNDMALIRLSSAVQFNQFIKPVCLPSGPPQNGVVCAIAGFGLTTPLRRKKRQATRNVLASGSSILMETDVPIVPRETCQSFFSAAFPGLITVTDSHVCAGSIYPVGKDSCQGDSGGPMVCRRNGRYEVVGITSFGVGCGRSDVFGAYTNVWHLLSWINSVKGSPGATQSFG